MGSSSERLTTMTPTDRKALVLAAVKARAEKLVANRLMTVPQLTGTEVSTPVPQEPTSISVKEATISVQELVVKADRLVLMVDNFAPAFNLSPTIDVTSPDIKVEVGSPNVSVEAPKVTVTNTVDVPPQEAPSVVNQITVPTPEVKEVNVTLQEKEKEDPKPKVKTVTITAPDGKKYTGTIREIES